MSCKARQKILCTPGTPVLGSAPGYTFLSVNNKQLCLQIWIYRSKIYICRFCLVDFIVRTLPDQLNVEEVMLTIYRIENNYSRNDLKRFLNNLYRNIKTELFVVVACSFNLMKRLMKEVGDLMQIQSCFACFVM